MQDAIKVIEQNGKQTVNARDLHAALGVGKFFANWIKDRIEKYGFTEGTDYQSCLPDLASKIHGGSNKIDYYLSLTTAKEIAMVENNDAGRKIRLYLIRVEEAWNSPEMIMSRSLQMSQKAIETYQSRIAVLEPYALFF